MTKKLLDQHDDKKPWEVNSDSDIRCYEIACIGKTKPHRQGNCKQEQARPFLNKFPLPRPFYSWELKP